MQIFYLSNRPQVFAQTWAYVSWAMPWVSEALVVAPASTHSAFPEDERITLVDEAELMGRTTGEIGEINHTERNTLLRRAAIESDVVAETFLLSDDDYRPMKPIPESFFHGADGDIGYFFHDLPSWPGDSTTFDQGQHVASEVLGYLGAPRRAYGSHMPQIMRRDIWKEAYEHYDRLRDNSWVCEWSLYFNIGMWLHPERFADPRPYETMCWPPRLHEFAMWVRPPAYSFENFYPEFYEEGNLFSGIDPNLDTDHNESVGRRSVEKLLRWSELGRRAERLDFDPAVFDPWTKQNPGRALIFKALRQVRWAQGHLSIGDRQRLAQLAGQSDDPR